MWTRRALSPPKKPDGQDVTFILYWVVLSDPRVFNIIFIIRYQYHCAVLHRNDAIYHELYKIHFVHLNDNAVMQRIAGKVFGTDGSWVIVTHVLADPSFNPIVTSDLPPM
jgi:hypothetical protein